MARESTAPRTAHRAEKKLNVIAFFTERPPLQPAEVAIGEIDNCAAVGADQVMVMFVRSPHDVAAAASAGMHFTDEPELYEYLERAVNRHQPDAGVLAFYPFVYRGRRQVLMTFQDGFNDFPALRGYFVAVLAEIVFNSLFGIDHFSLPVENVFHLEDSISLVNCQQLRVLSSAGLHQFHYQARRVEVQVSHPAAAFKLGRK